MIVVYASTGNPVVYTICSNDDRINIIERQYDSNHIELKWLSCEDTRGMQWYSYSLDTLRQYNNEIHWVCPD